MRILALVVAALCACASTSPNPRTAMPTEQNKQLVQRLYDDYLNPNKLDTLGDIVSADLANGDGTRGPTGFAMKMSRLRGAFPDLHYNIEDLVAEGDRVVVRWTLHGTHTGAFRGIEPSGKKIVNDGIAIFRIANGKIVQATVQTDRLGFLMSVGRIPYDPSFGPPPRSE